MKLLNCIICNDIFSLQVKVSRTCFCGRVSGECREDGDHVDIWSPPRERPRVLGCFNNSYLRSFFPELYPAAKDLKLFVFDKDYYKIHWHVVVEKKGK